ncbi:hypothetical protein HZC33_02760 [Candidatus Wolfebacteria bacterium]|nr:hypothetical protein [Candidatus Wolfebacteria bacterium]
MKLNKFKKIIIGLVIVFLFFGSFGGVFINKAQAQQAQGGNDLASVLGQATAQTAVCAAASAAVRYAQQFIAEAQSTPEATAKAAGGGGIPVYITNIGASAEPVKAKYNVTLQNGWDDTKKCIKDVLRKQLMDWTVDQVVDWIQNGGDLGSRFTIDWEKDKQSAWNAGAGAVINEVAPFLCSDFRAKVQLSYMPVQKFHKRLECTLDKVQANISDFSNDFNNGGWLAYNTMWQPQNNYFGVNLMIHDEAAARGSNKAEAAINDLNAGAGFKSLKSCKVALKSGDSIDDPWGGSPISLTAGDAILISTGGSYTVGGSGSTSATTFADAQTKNANLADIRERINYFSATEKIVKDNAGQYCFEANLKNATPGRVAGDMVQKYMVDSSDTALSALGDSEDWGKWITAIADAATNRLMKEGIGMMKKSGQTPAPSFPSGYDIASQQGTANAEKLISATSTQILAVKQDSLLFAKDTLYKYELINFYQKSSTKSSCLTPAITAFDVASASTTSNNLTDEVNGIQIIQTSAGNFIASSTLINSSATMTSEAKMQAIQELINGFNLDMVNYPTANYALTRRDALNIATNENIKLEAINASSTAQVSQCP